MAQETIDSPFRALLQNASPGPTQSPRRESAKLPVLNKKNARLRTCCIQSIWSATAKQEARFDAPFLAGS